MPTPTFMDKNGSLTRYSLACGYRERCVRLGEKGRELETVLFLDGCYHVLTVDRYNSFRSWQSFGKLADARKEYKRHCKLTQLTSSNLE